MGYRADESWQPWRHPAAWLLWGWLVGVFPPVPGWGQGHGTRELRGARVVILGLQRCCASIAWTDAEQRIQKELTALGVEVRLERHLGKSASQRLEELADRLLDLDAQAALSIHYDDQEPAAEIRLCLRPGGRGDPSAVSFRLREPKDSEGASIAALSAVEVIRAGLMEQNLQKIRLPNVERLETHEGLQRTSPGRAGPLELGIALVTLYSLLGLGFREGLALSVAWPLPRGFALMLEASGLFLGSDVRMGEQRASFGMASLRLLAWWHAWTRPSTRLSLGLGGGLAIPWSEGIASPDRPLKADAGISGEILAALRLAVRLGGAWWLTLGLGPALSVPEVRLRVDDRTEASLGRPFWEAALGAEVVLP